MARKLISSLNERTDDLAVLGINNITHTSVSLSWKNPSIAQATYRLMYRVSTTSTWTASDRITIEGDATEAFHLTGLKSGQAHYVRLERSENSAWVIQASTTSGRNYILFTTHPLITNDSTSSTAAVLKWTKEYTATYRIQIYLGNPSSSSPIKTFEQSSVTLSGSSYNLVVTGLEENVTYYAVMSANEAVNSSGGKSFVPVKEFTFETSKRVGLTVSSFFSTYANLVWDGTAAGNDEEDSVTEFHIQYWERVNNSWSSRGTAMPWTPDTTKAVKVSGLNPGSLYRFRLNRSGVHGTGTYQDQRDVTTLTTDLALAGSTTTTRAKVEWAPMYSNSRYKIRYSTAGQAAKIFGGTTGTTANEALLVNLVPETKYTIELLVVENGSSTLIDTLETTTHKSPPFSVIGSEYTSIQMSLESPATETTNYYFRTDIKGSSGGFVIANAQTVARDVRELEPGTTYKITLYRHEFGSWVIQSRGAGVPNYIAFTTKNSPDISTSVSTNSAALKWDLKYGSALYQMDIFAGVIGGGGSSINTYEGSDISTGSDGMSKVVVTSLLMNATYHGILRVKEPNRQGVVVRTNLKEVQFTTSEGATLQVGEVKASIVELSWDAGVVQEDDGVAEFKIRMKKNPSGEYSDSTAWMPHSINTKNITGLQPGTSYTFVLLRLGIDGSSRTQALVSVTTRGSTLRVDQTSSTSMYADWDEVYPGARYQIVYTADGGSPVVFGGGETSETSVFISGLKVNTNYVLQLYVIEDGALVGTNTLALGSMSEGTKGYMWWLFS